MMTGFDFSIIFDQSGGPYTPGQLVTGKVRMFFNSAKPVTKIKIKFEGRADVEWSEDKEIGNQSSSTRIQSDEQYFKSKLILYERLGDFKLSQGDHVYPFGVLLPKNIPSSFAGSYGKITYFAIAKIEISGHLDKTRKEFFFVKNFLNLNCFPRLKAPVEEQKFKKFYAMCCFPCGELRMCACVPRSGFVSNETIPLILEINNDSSVPLRKITAYVVQKVEWRAGSDRNHSKDVLKTFTLGSAKANSSATIVESVPVPEKDYPYLENCHIIILKYELWIEADPGAGHCDLDLSIPISIGDIAFIQDEPSHGDDHFLLSLDKDDAEISEFEFDETNKQEVYATYKPSDSKPVEIFTSHKKY
ncbi:arrestin domain-containing protein 1-like [Planococcus citri]|uniref:arrestin domain-containing protein 1-like n=1 Tax=Planococcus citri TaxID=170843 RepID=UPI0031F93CD3